MGFIASGVRRDSSAYVHESVYLYGRVELGAFASLWPQVVARAEAHDIHIGAFTNIQDFSMIHAGYESGTRIGEHCSVAHHCTIQGCQIGNNCVVGVGATIGDGCVIGDNCIIGAHTYLKDGSFIPPNSVVVGAPGRVVRAQDNFVNNRLNAFAYVRNAQAYRDGDYELWARPEFQAEVQAELNRLMNAPA